MIKIKVRGEVMDSRSNKYYAEDQHNSALLTRCSRNTKLYKEVYGRYENSGNLPLEDNTDEIDMEKLKELVLKQKNSQNKEIKDHLNIIEQRKRNIDEQKLYDINKILEKAKYENNKLKDSPSNLPKINKQLLSTLQSTELSLPEIKEASRKYKMESGDVVSLQENDSKEKELSMTRELKYHNLVEKQGSSQDLSLDLFSDLRPTENTITTKPIVEETERSKSDFHSSDISDIDIIKNSSSQNNDFFTSSYEFSKKDFMNVDDDFSDFNKKGSIFKIILLFLMIFIFAGVITYFVITYGIGVS